ncbi:MAG: CinA family protein [Candidatus Omnitrophota bacterium]|jgi:nicotinamide-nucleotide amidase
MQPTLLAIHTFLIKNRLTLAVAESCTGGLVSSLFTSLSGSSRYFFAGIVSYNNKAKENLLHIPHALIKTYGAVSAETAQHMALSVRKLTKTDFGIGITGIAGPTGAISGKPIGTVFIALNSRQKNLCARFSFSGTRAQIRKKTTSKTLFILKRFLHINQ